MEAWQGKKAKPSSTNSYSIFLIGASGQGLCGPIFCSSFENNASFVGVLFSKEEQKMAISGQCPEPLRTNSHLSRAFLTADEEWPASRLDHSEAKNLFGKDIDHFCTGGGSGSVLGSERNSRGSDGIPAGGASSVRCQVPCPSFHL